MPEQPYEYYCLTCGGTDVGHEVWVDWNAAEQKWDVDEGSCNYEYCQTCEDECRTDQRPITDVKTLAQIAIKNADLQSAQPLKE